MKFKFDSKIIMGIYVISNKIDGKFYLGRSCNIFQRLRNHFYKLEKNIHDNCYLQRAYNKYGIDTFNYKILCECSKDKLIKWEQMFLDLYKDNRADFVYNLSPSAKGGSTYLITDKIRKKISENKKEWYKNNLSPRLGKKHSEETKLIIGEKAKGKNTKAILQYDKYGSFIKEYQAINIAGKELNIECSHIGEACKGKRKTTGGFIWKYKNAIQSTNQ